jgi:galactosylxylosylprotein 3-beta-galactosyltransferase
MKIRNIADPRFADPADRWYDPHNLIFVGDDSRYAEGPFYAVAGHVIAGILRSGLVPRMGGPEGARLKTSPVLCWAVCAGRKHAAAA